MCQVEKEIFPYNSTTSQRHNILNFSKVHRQKLSKDLLPTILYFNKSVAPVVEELQKIWLRRKEKMVRLHNYIILLL
jgi:hypothetical protein